MSILDIEPPSAELRALPISRRHFLDSIKRPAQQCSQGNPGIHRETKWTIRANKERKARIQSYLDYLREHRHWKFTVAHLMDEFQCSQQNMNDAMLYLYDRGLVNREKLPPLKYLYWATESKENVK